MLCFYVYRSAVVKLRCSHWLKCYCCNHLWGGNVSFPLINDGTAYPSSWLKVIIKKEKVRNLSEHLENMNSCYHGCYLHNFGSFHSIRNFSKQKRPFEHGPKHVRKYRQLQLWFRTLLSIILRTNNEVLNHSPLCDS